LAYSAYSAPHRIRRSPPFTPYRLTLTRSSRASWACHALLMVAPWRAMPVRSTGAIAVSVAVPAPCLFQSQKLKSKSKSSEHLVSTTCGTVQSVQSIQEQHLPPGKSTPPLLVKTTVLHCCSLSPRHPLEAPPWSCQTVWYSVRHFVQYLQYVKPCPVLP
jgi:hypothetical protein